MNALDIQRWVYLFHLIYCLGRKQADVLKVIYFFHTPDKKGHNMAEQTESVQLIKTTEGLRKREIFSRHSSPSVGILPALGSNLALSHLQIIPYDQHLQPGKQLTFGDIFFQVQRARKQEFLLSIPS